MGIKGYFKEIGGSWVDYKYIILDKRAKALVIRLQYYVSQCWN
jgi:hypothetical protein